MVEDERMRKRREPGARPLLAFIPGLLAAEAHDGSSNRAPATEQGGPTRSRNPSPRDKDPPSTGTA
jgi:hypothetical protein